MIFGGGRPVALDEESMNFFSIKTVTFLCAGVNVTRNGVIQYLQTRVTLSPSLAVTSALVSSSMMVGDTAKINPC